MKQTNHFVAVEANIAAGKTTLLPKLAAALDWDPVQEPVEDKVFNQLLTEFTQNPSDSSKRINFQRYITERRAETVNNLPEDRNYLIERSLYSDLIFTQANFLSMEQPDTEFMLHYCNIQGKLREYPVISAVVYLRTTPEVAYQRLLSRGREAEHGTPFEYIRDIHHYHEAILPQICESMNTPLMTLDWNEFGCEEDVAQQLMEVLAADNRT